MRVHLGDRVHIPFDGHRRPPLVGVIVEQRCESFSGSSVLVVRRIDGGGLFCIPSSAEVDLLERAPSGDVRERPDGDPQALDLTAV